MKTITVSIRLEGGKTMKNFEVKTFATSDSGAFVVTHCVSSQSPDPDLHFLKTYTVTHAISGLATIRGLSTIKAAKEIMAILDDPRWNLAVKHIYTGEGKSRKLIPALKAKADAAIELSRKYGGRT